MTAHAHWEKSFKMESQQAQTSVYKSLFMQRRGETAHPVPPRPFYPEAAMLSQPNSETQPPPPAPPFVLEQNSSPRSMPELTAQTQKLLTLIEWLKGFKANIVSINIIPFSGVMFIVYSAQVTVPEFCSTISRSASIRPRP